jgi:hypothetical protein
VQMSRQIGSALGVAALIVVLGGSGDLARFSDAWLWAGGFALLAAGAALSMSFGSARGRRAGAVAQQVAPASRPREAVRP